MGLGLALRNAAVVMPVAPVFGDLLLAFSCAFYLYFLVLYLVKIASRPAVLFEDMVSAAARAGFSAIAMSMMLLAAALLPLGFSVPQVWWCGVILQISASGIGVLAIWRDPPEKRSFTTFQYLTFVGPIVGPIAGIPLGYVWQSIALILLALFAYVVITAGCLLALYRVRPPQALRPSLAIFLAPICLFALSFGLLGYTAGFWIFYTLACAVALCLFVAAPWLMRGGWTPLWGNFTFPIAAFVQVQIMAVQNGAGVFALAAVYAGLILGTPLILYIAYRASMSWITGELSEKTGAACA
jgi:tellurite resistance protein